MENYQWRSWARFVAYIDLVCSILGLLLICGSVILTILAVKNYPSSDKMDDKAKILLVVAWITIAIAIVATLISFWASIMLLKATKLGADPQRALQRACMWRNVCMVLLIVAIVQYIADRSYLSAVIASIPRILVIYVVWKYIKELKTRVHVPAPNPDDAPSLKPNRR